MIPAIDIFGGMPIDDFKDVLDIVDTSPTVNTSLHYDFLLWVKTNHTMGEANIILGEFVLDGLYPEEFLEQWRPSK